MSMTEPAPAAPAEKSSDGLIWQLLRYLGSFFDPLKSRTNAVLIAGFIAMVASKFNFEVDQERAADAVVAGAQQIQNGITLDFPTIIAAVVTVLGVYFRSNPRVSFSSKV